jgi:hypothetical protein
MDFIRSGDLWTMSTSLSNTYRTYGLYKVWHALHNILQLIRDIKRRRKQVSFKEIGANNNDVTPKVKLIVGWQFGRALLSVVF